MPDVTRRARQRPPTQRVLTGGEIDQVMSEERRKAYGFPEPSPPAPPMRETKDMVTRGKIKSRIDQEIAAEKRFARGL